MPMLGGLVHRSAVLRALSGGSVLLHVAQACSRLLLAFPRRARVSRGMCIFFRISGQAVRGSRDFARIFCCEQKMHGTIISFVSRMQSVITFIWPLFLSGRPGSGSASLLRPEIRKKMHISFSGRAALNVERAWRRLLLLAESGPTSLGVLASA